jgi:hypothetical protein
MTPTLTFLILSLGCAGAMDRFSALAEIESGCNDNAIGHAGEISRFQISVSVWHQYTTLPLESARNPFTAMAVAEAIMRDRETAYMRRYHQQVSDWEFAREWHCPARRHLSRADEDYCIRFQNLCQMH